VVNKMIREGMAIVYISAKAIGGATGLEISGLC
jgi:hypothetical protein